MRPVLTRTRAMSTIVGAAAIAWATACDPDPAEPEDEPVAQVTLAALDANSATLSLYDGLLGPVNLAGVSQALAPQKIIEQVEGGLDTSLADPTCLTLKSDRTSFLDLQFDRCRFKGVLLDGGLRVELTTEAGTCDGVECVAATVYTTRLDALTIGKSLVSAATSVLRIPTTPGEPRSYTAEVELTDKLDRELHLRHELTFTRKDGCVDAELGAEFMVDELAISVAATAVEICGNKCPRAGEVQIAWGNGQALAWEYTGDAEVIVRGPRGREFVLPLEC
ncbi:hypothetical protein OV203_12810 [Nannocystis sp. ILAH1]|uniref:hypothetical protein n=1 Tax=unclassified Nannocystis TaxID=2627009 RepID=UPI002271E1D1|nr:MULTISPECIES: hypothetical protein [unclassified Nannocystis]MCY0988010.1 hypothetical protein [Nannocystis sp. ILAH1]MCY1065647.1 hypothetical protein [Nannocystis sp. RBIL2]